MTNPSDSAVLPGVTGEDARRDGPLHRPRRLRRSEAVRRLVRETRLSPDQLVMPLFVRPGVGVEEPIDSMPGQFRYSGDRLEGIVSRLQEAGVRSVLLFGIAETKDSLGSEARDPSASIQTVVRTLAARFPRLCIITDVCLCAYTDHGHCGVLEGGQVNNDRTLPLLQNQAVSHADAGATMVAPSGMMDGMVGAIRSALDQAGHHDVAIMSYAAKYASAYYGPFREAAGSSPGKGDRKAYQMDPANAREALREVRLDVEEGADIVMVKPALAYLDIIRSVREMVDLPVACYNVSAEYSMIKSAAQAGLIDGEAVMLETLCSMRRAGADVIISYFALEAASRL